MKPLIIKKELADKLKRPGQTRSYPEIIAPQVVRFYYPCGHTSTINYAEQTIARKLSESAIKFQVRYWSNGGVSGICPKCQNKKRRDPMNKHKRFVKSTTKERIGPDWIEETNDERPQSS